MSSFYTRKGDDGFTGVLGEGRVPKSDTRMEALGAIDEATAALGVARWQVQSDIIPPLLLRVQKELYLLMAEVAATQENQEKFRSIGAEQVSWLEEITDSISQTVHLPKEFIIPGDTASGAALDLARTIVRRAERRAADLFHRNELSNVQILRYLNRLSSLLFVLELQENQSQGKDRPTLARG